MGGGWGGGGGGQKKISAWGRLNRFPAMDIYLGGYYVFCQKKDF